MLNYEFPPIGGGTGNACYYMLKEFAKNKALEIDLVTFSSENDNRIQTMADNIRIFYVKCGKKEALHYWKTSELLRWLIFTHAFLKSHLSQHSYNLIHCWSGWPAGMLGYRFRKHAPYVIALRGSDIPGYSHRTALLDRLVLKSLSRRIWSRAAEVTIVSEDAARLARKTANGRFTIIHNGVDNEEFVAASIDERNDTLKIVYIGRLIPRKGVQDLLKAFTILKRERVSDIELTIIGTGSMQHELQQFVKEEGLANVHFAGLMPHHEVATSLPKYDIFVLPSHAEAFSNAMQEAIASGLAIISTPTGGAELLDGNGWTINIADPTDLARLLKHLIQSRHEVTAARKRSAIISKTMGWDTCAGKYLEVYKRALPDYAG